VSELESSLYKPIEKWMCKHFGCFRSGRNVGLKYSRVDVLGVRDVGGMLSGEIETISIEVKRGTEPFATASGQALGYSIYANRVYLADRREREFKPAELGIASRLGIGLIHVKGTKCREILSSHSHEPMPGLSQELLAKLALVKCQICGTFFESGTAGKNWLSNVTRNRFDRAVKQPRKGLVFWLQQLAERKRKFGLAHGEEGYPGSFEKRFICPECIGVFSTTIPKT
jgi:hypothetical protein